jgi:hypothetical protein
MRQMIVATLLTLAVIANSAEPAPAQDTRTWYFFCAVPAGGGRAITYYVTRIFEGRLVESNSRTDPYSDTRVEASVAEYIRKRYPGGPSVLFFGCTRHYDRGALNVDREDYVVYGGRNFPGARVVEIDWEFNPNVSAGSTTVQPSRQSGTRPSARATTARTPPSVRFNPTVQRVLANTQDTYARAGQLLREAEARRARCAAQGSACPSPATPQ